MKKIYSCDICEKQFDSETKAIKCETKHKIIKEQMVKVVEEIKTLYKLGGSIKLTIGSHYSSLSQLAIHDEKNILLGKDWTFYQFAKPILEIKNIEILKEDEMIFSKTEQDEE